MSWVSEMITDEIEKDFTVSEYTKIKAHLWFLTALFVAISIIIAINIRPLKNDMHDLNHRMKYLILKVVEADKSEIAYFDTVIRIDTVYRYKYKAKK